MDPIIWKLQEGTNGLTKRFWPSGLRKSAQWLVKNIQRRKETILKVAQNIVNVQKDFFDRGVTHLKPLTLKQIAEKIEMHESTVSHVTSNKYMETPRGIFELKYFFSSGIESAYGETTSSTSVKAMIRRLIENEDKHKPSSDQKITELLNRRGLTIARRTAAKYREELGVPPRNTAGDIRIHARSVTRSDSILPASQARWMLFLQQSHGTRPRIAPRRYPSSIVP